MCVVSRDQYESATVDCGLIYVTILLYMNAIETNITHCDTIHTLERK